MFIIFPAFPAGIRDIYTVPVLGTNLVLGNIDTFEAFNFQKLYSLGMQS